MDLKKFVSRLRNRASQSSGTHYHVDTYIPNILANANNNFEEPDDREAQIEENAIAYNLTVKVANLITARSPIFLDKNENELDDVREAWEKENYDLLLNDVIRATRTHGYGVVEPLSSNIGKRSWVVHSSNDMIQIGYKEDYKIEYYKVMPVVEGGTETAITHAPQQKTLYPEDVIHHFIGKFDLSQQGLSVLKPIWKELVRFCEIEESMAMFDSRIGRGVTVASVDPDVYANEFDELHNALKTMNNRGFLILKNSDDGTPPILKMFPTATSGVNFPEDMLALLKVMSSNTGFSVRFLYSSSKGTQSTSTEDRIHNYQNLESIFMEYTDFIREVLKMQEDGEKLNDMVAEIKWDSGGNLPSDDSEELNSTKSPEMVRLHPVSELGD